MKIGILTYHRSQNYGALLQAFALQQFLEDNGNSVSFVDYWPSYHADEYKLFSWKKFKNLSFKCKIAYIIRFFGTCARTPLRQQNTRRFIEKNLHVTEDKRFDLVIYGSDQIWRRQNYSAFKGFNPVYFGDGVVETSKKVAYAASMGDIVVEDDNDRNILLNGFRNFFAIGVRAEEVKQFIEKQFHIPCKLVLDPVFLLTKEQWLSKVLTNCIPKQKYIFHYRLMKESPTEKIANKISKQTGLPIVEMRGVVPIGHYGKNKRFTDGPLEFISLIYGAEYIVASSFHGVALSICLEKDFFLCSEMKRMNRLNTLLSRLNLTERIINKDKIENINIKNSINYYEVNKKLFDLEQESREWLLQQITSSQHFE